MADLFSALEPSVETINSTAVLSDDLVYRYTLARTWDATKGTACFCGLNPSTATADINDPTVNREVAFARSWGYGRYVKVNAYGLRSTDPKGLWKVSDPFGPDNLRHVLAEAASAALFVAAWGANIRDVDEAKLIAALLGAGVRLHCLKITKGGKPSHPLYLRGDLKPILFREAKINEQD